MSKKITLEENIAKLQNCLMSVKTLSNILDGSRSQNSVQKLNRWHLRHTMRNVKRLNTVIQKQIAENVPYIKYCGTDEVIVNMINLIRDNKIDEFTVKRDSSFNNKVEIFEGNKYVGRYLIK